MLLVCLFSSVLDIKKVVSALVCLEVIFTLKSNAFEIYDILKYDALLVVTLSQLPKPFIGIFTVYLQFMTIFFTIILTC